MGASAPRLARVGDDYVVLASLGSRLAASAIDLILGWGIVIGAPVLVALVGDSGGILLFAIAPVGVVLWWVSLLTRGLTPGKVFVRICVRSVRGGAPGLATVLFRESIGKYVSWSFFGLGFLWAIWDPDRQTWHDKLAGTVVVRMAQAGSGAEPSRPPASGAPM